MLLPRDLLLVCHCAVAVATLLPAQNPPPGFTYQTLVDGPLNSATAMAFMPDGRLLITERASGQVRVFENGALRASPWATVAVSSGGSFAEQGLLGIAVDPGFLQNRYVYLFYTVASGSENVIARLEDQGGFGVNATVLTPPNAMPSALYHNGGPMVFGYDGLLYIGTGDALADVNAQDLSSWLGKVLRLQPPNLTVPAGNPFAGSPIWSYGHRNQFGLTIHPDTGGLYQTENGTALMDEVNRIVIGGNYGWPTHEGAESPSDPNTIDPLVVYQPTPAPTGTCFYRGEHWPAGYRNSWFVCDYNMNRLRRLTLDTSGNTVVAQQVFDTLPGAGYGVLSGPDGNLWMLTNDNGGFGADELGRYVHSSEPVPSAQLSSVSNKTLGASITVCVRGATGDLAVSWLSLARLPAAVATVFGDLWVSTDAVLPAMVILGDDRAYQGLSVPNAPTFLGASLHLQGLVVSNTLGLVLTNPSELVIRG
ncbi:MAG: PQQ-dependent sugar dehydrogenase [Planctomycetes bacterium]|jgi:glucose/arabinose dehydrogenase|nr:PQQ-dependent sugar dehydrogenase [Planctomycetota bacterium]